MKVTDVQALSLERVEAQANSAALADSESPGPVENGKSSPLPSASPESALSMLEALTERSAALAQTPVSHAADGSALAVTSLLSRAGETQVTSAPATPPAPAAQPQAPVIQVEGGLRWMLKGGTQEAELQLHPDSLGRVTIHLRVDGGEVHARLWITEPTSMQAVQEGRPHLELALKEQGLQLGSFDLQQGHRPFQEAPSASSFREPSFQEAAPARQEAPAPPSAGFLNSHHVELYA
jgi:flagellar hook-length control protein FliK